MRKKIKNLMRRFSPAWKEPRQIASFSVKRPLNGLVWANGGMIGRGNIAAMDYVVSRIQSRSAFVEIGSFCGLSANVITYFKTKYGRTNTLFCCDPWEYRRNNEEMWSTDLDIEFQQYGEYIMNSYLRNVSFFSNKDKPIPVQMRSREFFEMWRIGAETNDLFGKTTSLGGPIAFCYIDGDHSFEGAMNDFTDVDQLLEVGGYLLFDDSEFPGVKPVVKEVNSRDNYRLIAKNPNCLFVKIS